MYTIDNKNSDSELSFIKQKKRNNVEELHSKIIFKNSLSGNTIMSFYEFLFYRKRKILIVSAMDDII